MDTCLAPDPCEGWNFQHCTDLSETLWLGLNDPSPAPADTDSAMANLLLPRGLIERPKYQVPDERLVYLRVKIHLYMQKLWGGYMGEPCLDKGSIEEIRVLTHEESSNYPFMDYKEQDRDGNDLTDAKAKIRPELATEYPKLCRIEHIMIKSARNVGKDLEYEVTTWTHRGDRSKRFIKTGSWTSLPLPLDHHLFSRGFMSQDSESHEDLGTPLPIKYWPVFPDWLMERHIINQATSRDPSGLASMIWVSNKRSYDQHQDWLHWRQTLRPSERPEAWPISEFVSSLTFVFHHGGAETGVFMRLEDGTFRPNNAELQNLTAAHGKAMQLVLIEVNEHYTKFVMSFWRRASIRSEIWWEDQARELAFLEENRSLNIFIERLPKFLAPRSVELSLAAGYNLEWQDLARRTAPAQSMSSDCMQPWMDHH